MAMFPEAIEHLTAAADAAREVKPLRHPLPEPRPTVSMLTAAGFRVETERRPANAPHHAWAVSLYDGDRWLATGHGADLELAVLAVLAMVRLAVALEAPGTLSPTRHRLRELVDRYCPAGCPGLVWSPAPQATIDSAKHPWTGVVQRVNAVSAGEPQTACGCCGCAHPVGWSCPQPLLLELMTDHDARTWKS